MNASRDMLSLGCHHRKFEIQPRIGLILMNAQQCQNHIQTTKV